MKMMITKSTGSWYEVLDASSNYHKARIRGKFKLQDKKITNPVTVGDMVEVDDSANDLIITDILPRKNYVVRASPRKKGHHHMIAANLDQAMVIASLKYPRTSLGFIDRFLVTLEAFRIPGIVVFNKKDIYNEEELEYLDQVSVLYEKIGYRTMVMSFLSEGPASIKDLLKGKLTLLSGHSGTGKSTLINLLFPHADQSIGRISDFADKGVHTTTFGEMFVNESYRVIDTPGIKELSLAEIEKDELSHYFPEMRSLLGTCKYHNCQHIDEPGCMVKEAVMDGEIAESRFDSYLSMMLGDDNRR